MKEQYHFIGTIIGTHALRGEVKVRSVTDFKEERYKKGNTIHVETDEGMKPLTIEKHREHKGNDLLTFKGYNNINDVLVFNKCKLYIETAQLHELEEDEFYYHQLIGCTVIADNQEVGIVKDIDNYGASDILFIKDQNNKQIMVPFVDEFIEEVNLEEKRIVLDPIEGLLGE